VQDGATSVRCALRKRLEAGQVLPGSYCRLFGVT
jgi:hypothetical protein